MQQSDRTTADALLHSLLDRFEAPKERVRDITQTIDYTQIGSPAAQDAFHQVLDDAARSGAIVLEKNRLGRFTGEYARVRLMDAQALYRFLVRSPAATAADIAQRTLSEAIPAILEDRFFADVVQDAIAAWRVNKRFLGFGVMETEGLATVLRLTHGIVTLKGHDMDHRTFSRRIVKDSKALERWEGRIVQLLKRRNPELASDDVREILEASGIVRRAHLLQVRGPLNLVSAELTITGTGDGFIGLPWAAIQQSSLAQPIDYILTIENPTSFWRYCSEIDGCYLALLTDGFPARDVLSSIAHLVHAARQWKTTPIFHWGDVDAGGLRIAAHLEDVFGEPIRLHEMRPDDAARLGTPLKSRSGLNRLALRAGDIGALARALLAPDAMALEQEELDPVAPPWRDGYNTCL